MIKTIIVEDEIDALEILEAKLQELFPHQIQIVATAMSSEEAYPKIIQHRPDLVFLDIAMPRESGFDLLKKLPSLDFEIIFVTGFSDYAIDAMKYCAIGYITKPILDEDLIHAIRQAINRFDEKQANLRNSQLLDQLQNSKQLDERVHIPTAEGFELIPSHQIIRCEGVKGCTKIIIQNRNNIISSYNIGEYKNILSKFGFYSPHKSHLIHHRHIESYKNEGYVIMSDGASIPVARAKKNEFLLFLKRQGSI